MKDTPKNRGFITDSILLAALSAYVYLVTFVYEYSYCSNFKIPKSLITPSLTTILVATLSIGALLLSVLKYLGLSAPFFRALADQTKEPFHPFFAVNGLSLIFFILALYVYPFSWTLLIGLLVGILFLNLVYYGIPLLLAKRKQKSLREGMEEINNDEDKLDLTVLLMRRLGKREKWLTMFVLCTLGVSYMIGDGEAIKQTRFPMVSGRPNTVVLRMYGDLFICSKLDRTSRTVSDSLVIFHTSNMPEFGVHFEEVGPLKVRKRHETLGEPADPKPRSAVPSDSVGADSSTESIKK